MGTRSWRVNAAVVVCSAVGWFGCHSSSQPPPTNTQPAAADAGTDSLDAGVPPDAGIVDAGTLDAGSPDAGVADAGTPDAGAPDAGPRASLWPTDPQLSFSSAYGLPGLAGVSIDDDQNIWVLTGDNRVGALRPSTGKVSWAPSGFGQTGKGFGATCICAGEPGRAYVGFWASDPTDADKYFDPPLNRSMWSPGDVDVLDLDAQGNVAFNQHMNLFNSNDHHYNEVQGIFTCVRVMRGQFKNEVYVGSNHAVTRIRGLDYADHRHAVWDVNGSLKIGYNKAVGIAQNGDLLIGNEWKVALLTPPPDLMDFISFDVAPWRLDTYVMELGALEDMDFWKATAQTTDGLYYWGGDKGLWQAKLKPRPPPDLKYDPTWTQIAGIGWVTALAATDDGSLFIGSDGLWRMKPDKTLERMSNVPGDEVINLVYDPNQTPSMLLVLTNAGLTVLRGY